MAGIKDVAALAGVSISTVSYVMTGKPVGEYCKLRGNLVTWRKTVVQLR